VAHELSHAIGYSIEHYGATANNANYSLMSVVSPRLLDGRNIAHHDPLFKIKMGWLTPTIVRVDERKDLVLRATELPWYYSTPQAYIVYDPIRGPGEFFILEYRSNASGNAKVPLYSWYSPARGDNFLTADPAWAGKPGDVRSPDYRFMGVEGYADPTTLAGFGSKLLRNWYSPSRMDNFATTDPSWEGTAGSMRAPDYWFIRNEAVLYPTPEPGSLALHSWYSPSRGDNFATTDPAWQGGPGVTRPPDYGFVRVEGYASLRVPVNYDADPWRSGHLGIPDSGLAIWHVKLDSNKNPEIRKALYAPDGQDRAVYIVPPGGRLGRPEGNGLWDKGDGEAAPPWLDGTASGLIVRVVSEPDSPYLTVRLGR
jgi:hypothetical protein